MSWKGHPILFGFGVLAVYNGVAHLDAISLVLGVLVAAWAVAHGSARP